MDVLEGERETTGAGFDTPKDGLVILADIVGEHLRLLERLELFFFGMVLGALPPERRKAAVLAFLEHAQELREGVREILHRKDRLAAILGVELNRAGFAGGWLV